MASSETATLRDARTQAGMLQRDVAREAGCAISFVSMVENGYEPARKTDVLARIAVAVGGSYGSFFGRAA